MAADELPVVPDALEDRLRRRLRVVAGFTILGLIVVLAIAYTFGGPDIHASEFVFGSLIGALLLLAGVEAGARYFGNGNGKR